VAPFEAEWRLLEGGNNKKRYRPFHRVETLVPFVFFAVHAAQGARNVPWAILATLVGGAG
jgi:hypothetical protein